MKQHIDHGAVGSITILSTRTADDREVDHRVANSLQLITALLSLQAKRTGDARIGEALTAAVHRVAAIGAVHRQLCRSGSGGSVDMADYLADLATGLEQGGCDARRQVHVQAEAAFVPASFASVLGVIVTELVMNAFKHAYVPGGPGDVDIRIVFPSASHFALEVRDYGRSVALKAPSPRAGLGTDIINVMSRRLDATHSLRADELGTRFSMTGSIPDK